MNHDYFPEDEYETGDPIKSTPGKIYTIPKDVYLKGIPLKVIIKNMVEEILKEKGLI